ncbi:hypothetical protein BB560_004225, partial [Smittium megazygosporum]
MRYLAAYLLLHLGAHKNVSADQIVEVISAVGIDADKERAEKVVAELEGKSIEEVIAE